MPNLHPPFSAFPLALVLVAAFFEILGFLFPFYRDRFQQAIGLNLFVAVVFAVGAFLTGYQASEIASQTFAVPDQVIVDHHNWGRLFLLVLIPCCLLHFIARLARYYRRTLKVGYYLLLLGSLWLVIFTGYLGGRLVFVHGAGVKVHETSLDTDDARGFSR